MDYDIFKLHHPFSMLVAGPRGTEKREFVKQLLSLKCYIMMNPPERIVWFYERHQPDLFCSLTQEIPSMEFYECLPMNIEVMFNRSKCAFHLSELILYGKKCRTISLNSWSSRIPEINLKFIT